MRSIVITTLVGITLLGLGLLPTAALAQTVPQTAAVESTATASPAQASPTPAAAGGVTRDQFIQRAQERAAQRAGVRFDQMDTDHDGVLDRTEIRAWRSQHPRRAAAQPSQPTQQ